MPISVICPNCSTENYGSSLHCKNCQASLIGVSRQEETTSANDEESRQEDNSLIITGNHNDPQPDSDFIIANGRAAMFAEIRSWGMWSLGLGVLHILTSGFLSAPWGILLVLVGLASFYFRSASMFVVYTVTLGWAGISNILGLEIGWIAFGIYQIYLAVRIFKQYHHFQNIENKYFELSAKDASTPIDTPARAQGFFPWLGSFFGCSSIIGFVLFFVIIAIIAGSSNGEPVYPGYFNIIDGMIMNFGILGIAISLASLLSKYRWKALAIMGLIGGILTISIELIFIYLL